MEDSERTISINLRNFVSGIGKLLDIFIFTVATL